jgi:ribosomal protein L3 glutamine methyltransferase
LTLRELIARTARQFRAAKLHFGHGTDNAHDEAAFLVLRGLGLPFSADLSAPADPGRVEALVRRRIQERIPAPYLLNEAWLDGQRFYVDRRVIIPRSHIAFLLKDLRIEPRRILDLCTGSGCLAILAARAFPKAQVDASDLSAEALKVAARNVREHRLGGRISLVRSDLFASLKRRYDLIVSNPPYVATRAMRELPPEYRYEPGLALASGRQGLDHAEQILAAASGYLRPGGMLVCEVGDRKRALERAWPGLALRWPQPEVFILEASRKAGSSRTRPTRSRAK